MTHRLKDGRLQIISNSKLVWDGRLDNRTVVRVASIPSTEDCLVLLDPSTDGVDRNLLRIARDGSVVWRAPAPPEGGTYVDVQIQNGLIVAWSWTCHMVTLEAGSGSISEAVFTK